MEECGPSSMGAALARCGGNPSLRDSSKLLRRSYLGNKQDLVSSVFWVNLSISMPRNVFFFFFSWGLLFCLEGLGVGRGGNNVPWDILFLIRNFKIFVVFDPIVGIATMRIACPCWMACLDKKPLHHWSKCIKVNMMHETIGPSISRTM